MDKPTLNWDYNSNTKIDCKEQLARMYGLFEENYRNTPKTWAISKGAKSCMELIEKVFFPLGGEEIE